MRRKRVVASWAAVLAVGVFLAVGAVSLGDEDGPDPWQGPGAGSDDWIYDDIDAAYAAAKKSGKPILVGFR